MTYSVTPSDSGLYYFILSNTDYNGYYWDQSLTGIKDFTFGDGTTSGAYYSETMVPSTYGTERIVDSNKIVRTKKFFSNQNYFAMTGYINSIPYNKIYFNKLMFR